MAPKKKEVEQKQTALRLDPDLLIEAKMLAAREGTGVSPRRGPALGPQVPQEGRPAVTRREKILAEISAAADRLVSSDPRFWSSPEPAAAPPVVEGFLDVVELAALLKISRSTIYAKLGDAPFKDFLAPQDGIRRRRFSRSTVMAYLAQGGA